MTAFGTVLFWGHHPTPQNSNSKNSKCFPYRGRSKNVRVIICGECYETLKKVKTKQKFQLEKKL